MIPRSRWVCAVLYISGCFRLADILRIPEALQEESTKWG